MLRGGGWFGIDEINFGIEENDVTWINANLDKVKIHMEKSKSNRHLVFRSAMQCVMSQKKFEKGDCLSRRADIQDMKSAFETLMEVCSGQLRQIDILNNQNIVVKDAPDDSPTADAPEEIPTTVPQIDNIMLMTKARINRCKSVVSTLSSFCFKLSNVTLMKI